MTDRRDIDVVVFDIGGVIVQMRDIATLGPFGGHTESSEIMKLWLDCPHVDAHESGEIDARAFATRMVETYSPGCTPVEFLQRCLDWHLGLFPDVEATIAQIRPGVRIACLSNTSDFSWTHAPACIAAARLFPTQFLSYRLGMMKPDARIFRTVAGSLGVAPKRILFFDDTERHVAGARQVGLQAHRVAGIGEAREILDRKGLLRRS
jgi:putative hydrolase of the HAD superfamily